MKKAIILICLVVLICNTGYAENYDHNLTFDVFLLYQTIMVSALADDPFITLGAQYERQLADQFSAALRLDYRNLINMEIYMAGIHGRFYPDRERMFFDFMAGYAFLKYDSAGSDSASYFSHLFRLGPKFGWRFDIGNPGGFMLDISFGYYFVLGEIHTDFTPDGFWGNFFAFFYDSIIREFFAGGPQGAISIGYRF